MTVSGTPGTGTVTLGSAASGYISFGAYYGANATVPGVMFVDGTDFEIARDCAYTHTGTTLGRGTREYSTTGSALSLTSAAEAHAILLPSTGTSLDLELQTCISGLLVTKNASGNTLDISAGYCFDPSCGRVISYAGATGVSAGTLGASQWNQVYIYDSSGTATIEVVNNAAPPSSTYAGTARKGGTGSNRRWIGSFMTTSGSAIYAQDVKEGARNQIDVSWLSATNTTPFRCLSAGTATSYTAVSLVGAVPRYVGSEVMASMLLDATAAQHVDAAFSVDGSALLAGYNIYSSAASQFPRIPITLPLESSTPQIYYKMSGSNTPKLYIDVYGYRAAR